MENRIIPETVMINAGRKIRQFNGQDPRKHITVFSGIDNFSRVVPQA
jgi:hypothetical protein